MYVCMHVAVCVCVHACSPVYLVEEHLDGVEAVEEDSEVQGGVATVVAVDGQLELTVVLEQVEQPLQAVDGNGKVKHCVTCHGGGGKLHHSI